MTKRYQVPKDQQKASKFKVASIAIANTLFQNYCLLLQQKQMKSAAKAKEMNVNK